MDLLTPSSHGGLPTLSLTTNSSWLPWGRVAMHLISPLIPVPQSEIINCDTTNIKCMHLYLYLYAMCQLWNLKLTDICGSADCVVYPASCDMKDKHILVGKDDEAFCIFPFCSWLTRNACLQHFSEYSNCTQHSFVPIIYTYKYVK